MSMPSIRGGMRAALLAASMIGFSGAQRVGVTADAARPAAFDPWEFLRRQTPARPRNRTTTWRRSATQAKEAAKRLARGQAGADGEWQKRMAWNETVYPRVLAHQAKQRRDAAGWR